MIWRGDDMEGDGMMGRWYGGDMIWSEDDMKGRWYRGEMVWRGMVKRGDGMEGR